MHKIVFLMIALVIASAFLGYGGPISDISDICGVDLSGATVESEVETRDDFLGDGMTQIVLQDSSIADDIEKSRLWKPLPLSENLSTFVYQPYNDEISIPEIENGYYFFYDRHPESKDHYDDSDLFDRYSFNFTLAIYDTDESRLYLLEYDT